MSGKIQGNLLRREIHAPHVLADNSKELIYPAYSADRRHYGESAGACGETGGWNL